MEPFPAVEDLDVLKDFYGSCSLIFKPGAINALRFQALEEVLGHSVVPAVAPAAHALADQGIAYRQAL